MREFIVELNNFSEESDKVIERSRDILGLAHREGGLTLKNLHKFRDFAIHGKKYISDRDELIYELNCGYVDIIKCIRSLEKLAQLYANELELLDECGNNPWDPRCTKEKYSCKCSFLDPQC